MLVVLTPQLKFILQPLRSHSQSPMVFYKPIWLSLNTMIVTIQPQQQLLGTINFIGDAPSLTTTKIATATDDAGATITSGNVTNIDSNGLIDFKVTIPKYRI
jgi:hypothetical protein